MSLDRLTALVDEAQKAFTGQPKALWSDRSYISPKDAAALRTLATEIAEIKARIADNKTSEWFVYEIFYGNPIEFARSNLVIALQRHLLGLPLKTPEEEQREMLDGMSEENRAAWWRAENARRLAIRGVESA